jgi:hypothetical protein
VHDDDGDDGIMAAEWEQTRVFGGWEGLFFVLRWFVWSSQHAYNLPRPMSLNIRSLLQTGSKNNNFALAFGTLMISDDDFRWWWWWWFQMMMMVCMMMMMMVMISDDDGDDDDS